MKDFDVMVLGAGMVGIATALHLLERGRSVALVDRRGPAEETSFGNAGLIQAEAVVPYAFPLSLPVVLGVIAGRRAEARLSWPALPAVAPWLLAYARHGTRAMIERTAQANLPLVRRAVAEHDRLVERAGAGHLVRRTGYARLYRSEAAMERAVKADEAVRERYGIAFEPWSADRLRAEEPHVSDAAVGAIHVPEPLHLVDPSDLGKAYAALFAREGGVLATADAATLRREGAVWRVDGAEPVRAAEAVVALGPWSGDLLRRLGTRVPLGIKRGYHQHYGAAGNAVLNRLVVDEANGIVIGPNRRGIRLSTGAEFARRADRQPPSRLARAEPHRARGSSPSGRAPSRRAPWLGAPDRCMPRSSCLMIGARPGSQGLWAELRPPASRLHPRPRARQAASSDR